MSDTDTPAKMLSWKPRNGHRRRAYLPVTVRCLGTQTNARILNISTTGAAVDLMGPFVGAIGSLIRVEATEISFLEGRVRWLNKSRIGVEFEASTNAAAKVKAYFKFFHKEPVVTI